MKKLIINADDLGISKEVNAQIKKCIELGVITSSSLMANAPAFDEGVSIAKKYPQISVGVHLNIIEFAPLTNQEVFRKHGMLDEFGNFIDGAAFVVSYDDELKKAIYEEWDTQIEKMEEYGLTPTHCDSHQHTHTIIALQDILCQVLNEHHIKRVRRTAVPSIRLMLRAKKQAETVQLDKSKAMPPKRHSVVYRRIHLFVVKFTSWWWNRQMGKKYTMTDGFYSFDDYYSNADILGLQKKETIELMCHPGNKPFEKETEFLMKDMHWLDKNCQMIAYHKL